MTNLQRNNPMALKRFFIGGIALGLSVGFLLKQTLSRSVLNSSGSAEIESPIDYDRIDDAHSDHPLVETVRGKEWNFVYFQHIRKSGGTTFTQMLKDNLNETFQRVIWVASDSNTPFRAIKERYCGFILSFGHSLTHSLTPPQDDSQKHSFRASRVFPILRRRIPEVPEEGRAVRRCVAGDAVPRSIGEGV